MNTVAGKRPPRGADAGSLELEDQASLPLLAELALALPWKMAHSVRVFLRPGATQPGRDGIDVLPMSGGWLQQSEANRGKYGDDAL